MLHVEGIHKIYKDGKKNLYVLQGIDIDILRGEVVAVVGPSGAGKSTLLHIMGGIDSPNEGKIFLDNCDFYALSDSDRAYIRNRKIGFVFQFYHLLNEFSALENAMMPALIRMKGEKVRRRDVKERAVCLLRELGLQERLRHRPNELSGGEQQRVAIARALINSPDILLCDEPTGNLDSVMGWEILDILFRFNKEKRTTIVIVTHDKDIAKKAERILEMKDGKVQSRKD